MWVSGAIAACTGAVCGCAPATFTVPDIVAGVAPPFWNVISKDVRPPLLTARTLAMLTSAVAAPLTLIATGIDTAVVPATARLSDTRAAFSTRATTPALTLPGATFAGGSMVNVTRAFSPGSSVVTMSDIVSQLPAPSADALAAYSTLPSARVVASTPASCTVTRSPALRLVTTNDRWTEAPGSTVTAMPPPAPAVEPTGAICSCSPDVPASEARAIIAAPAVAGAEAVVVMIAIAASTPATITGRARTHLVMCASRRSATRTRAIRRGSAPSRSTALSIGPNGLQLTPGERR